MNPIKKMIERRAARTTERKRYETLLYRGVQIGWIFAAHRYCGFECSFTPERRMELELERDAIIIELSKIGYPR
jgi:hypothetical protein